MWVGHFLNRNWPGETGYEINGDVSLTLAFSLDTKRKVGDSDCRTSQTVAESAVRTAAQQDHGRRNLQQLITAGFKSLFSGKVSVL